MRLNEFFAMHPVFTTAELTAFLAQRGSHNPWTRKALLAHHQKQGHLLRVRRGLYRRLRGRALTWEPFGRPWLLSFACPLLRLLELWWWIKFGLYQYLPVCDSFRVIQPQQPDRGLTNRGDADNLRVGKSEMLAPVVLARIEERNDCSTRPVNRCQVRAFMKIAVYTCQSQIFTDCLSAVLESCQMINVMCARVCQLRHQAVFAAFPGPLNHETAQMLRHV